MDDLGGCSSSQNQRELETFEIFQCSSGRGFPHIQSSQIGGDQSQIKTLRKRGKILLKTRNQRVVRGDSFSFGICKGGDQRVPKFRLLCGCGGDPEECLAVCQQNSKLKSTDIDNIDNVLGNIEDISFDYVFDSFWGLVPWDRRVDSQLTTIVVFMIIGIKNDIFYPY